VFLAERLWPARLLARRALARAGAVTACSGELHARAVALGSRPERTRTVPYGVDVSAFSPERGSRGFREGLQVPEGRLLVVAFGRMVEKKGFGTLVEAAARTRGVSVVIAGDGDLRPELLAQIREREAPVRLLGSLERDSMANALAAADVVAIPRWWTGRGRGRPQHAPQASQPGGPWWRREWPIPDVVSTTPTGSWSPRDPAALAAALERLVGEPATRERLARAARGTALRRLTWEEAARRFEEAYAQAAALDPR
jgi:glycosyltransferase involved in cell wall biosynthesis